MFYINALLFFPLLFALHFAVSHECSPLSVSLFPSAAIDNAIGVFMAREFVETIGVTFGFIRVFLGIGSGSIFYCKVNCYFHHYISKVHEWRLPCILFCNAAHHLVPLVTFLFAATTATGTNNNNSTTTNSRGRIGRRVSV